MLRSLLIFALAAPLWACGADDTEPTDETSDTGRDRPSGDAGSRDTGTPDAGSSDSGAQDSGSGRPDTEADAAADSEPDTESETGSETGSDAGSDTAPDTTAPDAGTDELASVTRLRAQRDAWITNFCNCYGPAEYGTFTACRDAMETRWDPGLSACEQAVFESAGGEGEAFVTCITETFLIAETSCIDCPDAASLEYELCSDPTIDLQFCFAESSPAVQDALVACGG